MTSLGSCLVSCLLPHHAHVLVSLAQPEPGPPNHSPPHQTHQTQRTGGVRRSDAELRRCADRLLGSPIAACEGRRCHAARCTDGAAKKRRSEASRLGTDQPFHHLFVLGYFHLFSSCSIVAVIGDIRSPMAYVLKHTRSCKILDTISLGGQPGTACDMAQA